MCEPSRVWSRAISTQSFQRPSSIASRNALDPLALVRSPIIRTLASWRNGTDWYSEAAAASGRTSRRTGVMSATASATWRMCSGVVPQQPPISAAPYSVANRVSASASSGAVSG